MGNISSQTNKSTSFESVFEESESSILQHENRTKRSYAKTSKSGEISPRRSKRKHTEERQQQSKKDSSSNIQHEKRPEESSVVTLKILPRKSNSEKCQQESKKSSLNKNVQQTTKKNGNLSSNTRNGKYSKSSLEENESS